MHHLLHFIIIAGLSLFAYWAATGYLWVEQDFYLMVLGLPFLFFIKKEKSVNWAFAVFAFGALCAAVVLPARTVHLFALLGTVFFVFSLRFGYLTSLPLLAVLLLSPLAKNIGVVFGFPLRLALTKIAAKTLSFAGFEAAALGNVIQFRGVDFAVDPACMGLSMVHISLFFVLLAFALFMRKTEKKLHFAWLFALLACVFALNLFFNLNRILLLVLMGWTPDMWMHEAAGLFGLALYVLLPTWFLCRFLFQKFGQQSDYRPLSFSDFLLKNKALKIHAWAALTTLCLGLVWIATTQTERTITMADATFPALEIPALEQPIFSKKNMQHGITQYRSDDLLVYVKPLLGFYSSEHTPLVCWEGSGYRFTESGESSTTAGKSYFMGRLQKEKDVLFTAWWYSNGQQDTNSQWVWRWDAARGAAPYFLVNVSAASELVLKGEVAKLLDVK